VSLDKNYLQRTANKTPSSEALAQSWQRLRACASNGKDSLEFGVAMLAHAKLYGGTSEKAIRQQVLKILGLPQ
jgi:hypothetical protein